MLGDLLDDAGSTRAAVKYRLGCAEKMYWASRAVFSGPGSVVEKLKAWARGPQASAVYGAGGWALSVDLLRELWQWELKWLRRMLRLRWNKAKEGYVDYLKRSSEQGKKWMNRYGVQGIHTRAPVSYFSSSWRECALEVGTGQKPLSWIRPFRARSS